MKAKLGNRHLLEMARREIENMTGDKALAAHGDEGEVAVKFRDIRKFAREALIARSVHAPRGPPDSASSQNARIRRMYSLRRTGACSNALSTGARRSRLKRRIAWSGQKIMMKFLTHD